MIQRIDEWLSKQIMKGLTVRSVKGFIKGLGIAVKDLVKGSARRVEEGSASSFGKSLDK